MATVTKTPRATKNKKTSMRSTFNVNSAKAQVFREFSAGKFACELIAEGRFPDLKESTIKQYYYAWREGVALREAVVRFFAVRAAVLAKELTKPVELDVLAALGASLCRYALNTELTFYRRDKPEKLVHALVLRWRSTLGFQQTFILSDLDPSKGIALFDNFVGAMLGVSKN